MKIHLMTVLCSFVLLCSNANAAFVDVTIPGATSGTLSLTGLIRPATFAFSGASVVEQILHTNDQKTDLPKQSPDKIKAAVEGQFGVSNLIKVGDSKLSGKVGSITSSKPFDFLAIHFGQHELFFKFLTSVTEFQFTIDGHLAGLSNFRAFSGAVPIPAAVWLFGSALAGLLGLSRRKAS